MPHHPKLVILDRDGVINHDSPQFIRSPDEWIPIDGSLEAIAELNQAGYQVAIATNQSGIGRGLFGVAALNAMHEKMHRMLAIHGGHVAAIFFCPHIDADACACRKPRPGMLHDIARRLGADLHGVPMIGDALRDLQAGAAAGCAPHLVLTGQGARTLEAGNLPAGTRIHGSLREAVRTLLSPISPPRGAGAS